MNPGRFTKEFAIRRPHLFHVASEGAWQCILDQGMYSSAVVVRMAGLPSAERNRLTAQRRGQPEDVALPGLGHVRLRDQHPINPQVLMRCLDGITVGNWYRLLSNRVFFYANHRHALRMLKSYGNQVNDILVFETATVLSRNQRRVEVTFCNSGATPRGVYPRSRSTFTPLNQLNPADLGRVQEVAISGRADGVAAALERVTRHNPGGREEVVWLPLPAPAHP